MKRAAPPAGALLTVFGAELRYESTLHHTHTTSFRCYATGGTVGMHSRHSDMLKTMVVISAVKRGRSEEFQRALESITESSVQLHPTFPCFNLQRGAGVPSAGTRPTVIFLRKEA